MADELNKNADSLSDNRSCLWKSRNTELPKLHHTQNSVGRMQRKYHQNFSEISAFRDNSNFIFGYAQMAYFNVTTTNFIKKNNRLADMISRWLVIVMLASWNRNTSPGIWQKVWEKHMCRYRCKVCLGGLPPEVGLQALTRQPAPSAQHEEATKPHGTALLVARQQNPGTLPSRLRGHSQRNVYMGFFPFYLWAHIMQYNITAET